MDTKDQKTTDKFVRPRFRAYDAYYHANAKGTGSACKISLHPAHDDTAGSIIVSLAPQSSVGGVTFPVFGWADGITARLDRNDLALVLEVLLGRAETINYDRGIFHRTHDGNLVIRFAHKTDPQPNYVLSLWLKPNGEGEGEGEARVVSYVFNMHEAFSLMLSLKQAMVYVAFGVPEVLATDRGQTTDNL